MLTQYYWPENFRINELVPALQEKGITVEVLTGKPNYPRGVVFEGYRAWGCVQEKHMGVPVYRVPVVPRARGVIRLVLNYLSFILSGIFFGGWQLRGKGYDAIFVFAPSPILQAIPAIWLGWLKKAPVLLWVQDLWPESLSSTGHVTHHAVLKIVEHVVRWIYRKVDLLLVQSKAFIPRVKALGADTPIIYYPNSFIESINDNVDSQVACQGFDCTFPILFAGNLGSAQAVEVVLEVATKLNDVADVCFVMVGEGSRRNWMMQQALERGLTNIVFPGPFPVDAMPVLMGKAAALLVTLADTEIFRLTIPSKVQAYLAAGRPIIACLNGAGADIVMEARAGVTVPAEDGAALASTISALCDVPEAERAQMGVNGRSYYEKNFSQDKLVGELIEHFEQTVRDYLGKKI